MASYFGAPVSKHSMDQLKKFDVKDNLHMTVFFDHSDKIKDIQLPYFPKNNGYFHTGVISNIVEWNIRGTIFIVAELSGTDWSHFYNKSVRAYGIIEDLPHVPHITLKKGADAGDSKKYADLVGLNVDFTGVFFRPVK